MKIGVTKHIANEIHIFNLDPLFMKAGYLAQSTINKLSAKAVMAQIIPLDDAASSFIVTSQ